MGYPLIYSNTAKNLFYRPKRFDKINYNHPVARGLIADWELRTPQGTILKDYVSNIPMSFNNLANAYYAEGGARLVRASGTTSGYLSVTDSNLPSGFPGNTSSGNSWTIAVCACFRNAVPGGVTYNVCTKSGTDQYFLYLNTDQKVYAYFGSAWTPGAFTMTPGKKHIFVGVYDGSTYYIYADGLLDASLGATVGDSANNLLINTRFDISNTRSGDGVYDFIRSWDRALSTDEVRLMSSEPYCYFKTPVYSIGKTSGAGPATHTCDSAPLSLGAMTVSGTGEIIYESGTANLVMGAIDVSGSAYLLAEGTAAITLGAIEVDGVGTTGTTGTGAITFGAVEVDGSGYNLYPGSGVITFGAISVSGTGINVYEGSGVIPLGSIEVDGTGLLLIDGSGVITFGAISVSGVGNAPAYGTGVITLGGIQVSGQGNNPDAQKYGPRRRLGIGRI